MNRLWPRSDEFIRHVTNKFVTTWMFSEEEAYEHALARSALRNPNVAEESRLHVDRCHHAGGGHRREHGDLQRRQCGRVTTIALPRSRPIGSHLSHAASGGASISVIPGIFGFRGETTGFREFGGALR